LKQTLIFGAKGRSFGFVLMASQKIWKLSFYGVKATYYNGSASSEGPKATRLQISMVKQRNQKTNIRISKTNLQALIVLRKSHSAIALEGESANSFRRDDAGQAMLFAESMLSQR